MKKIFTRLHNLLRISLVGMLTTVIIQPSSAQSSSGSAFDNSYIFWGSPAAYLNYQAKIAYPLIDQMLQANPPATEINPQRHLALTTLDLFLHDAEYQKREAFYSFIDSRLYRAICSLDEEKMSSGVEIYKFYNCGFVLKSAKTTIAIDIVQGGTSYKPCVHDSIIYELVNHCDALLITNNEAGHANKKVASIFINSGKKVYAPEGVLTNIDGINYVGEDGEQTVELGGMTLHVLPVQNGKKTNNIYIMDFSGSIVAHTGGQTGNDDLAWIDQVHNKYKIDVLLTKSQNTDLESILAGIKPGMAITMGENEMVSAVDKRESYWTTQKRLQDLDKLSIPNIVMVWGERFHLGDNNSSNSSAKAEKKIIDGVLYIMRNGNTYTTSGMKVN